jgi:uncharacterized protein (DUF305 family)
MKKRWLVSMLLSLLLVFAVSFTVGASEPVEGRVGRAEVRFMQGMADHHTMALMMAYHCLDHATTESMQTLCQNIIDKQTAEIAQLQGWLRDWYGNDYMAMMDFTTMNMEDMRSMMMGMMESMMQGSMMGDMGGMHGMHGNSGDMRNNPPMMMGMMAGLDSLEGVDYEIAFLESMIDHHDDAIHMSERLLERSPEGEGHTELHAMAQQIIADQTAEIATMEQMLTELSAQ